jgi:hypothetical protein
MSKGKEIGNEIARFVGMFVLGALFLIGVILLVYGVLGNLTDTGRHILATALIFLIPIAYVLGLREGKAHRSGLERGIDLKLGARERAQARPSPAQPMTGTSTPARSWDELLPRPEQGAIIVSRSSTDNTPIDL